MTATKQRRHMRIDKAIHFIGIGGVGMSGIAEVLNNLGYIVTGSDLAKSANVDRLVKQGIKVYSQHEAENVSEAALIVISSAIPKNNPEIEEAKRLGIPIVRRAQMLAELMRFRYGITIAGTHGKTSTTAMIATVFESAGLDPTFINGGIVKTAGSNARLGAGEYLIAEADESDASFLHLNPFVSVVLNIEEDHMETYDGDINKMKQNYLNFLHNIPFYGYVVVCNDSPLVRDIIPDIGRRTLTYGYEEGADYQIVHYENSGNTCKFSVKTPEQEVIELELGVAGKHMASNATAAFIVAINEGVSIDKIRQGLKLFSGAGRRFDKMGDFELSEERKVTVIDDYGHHPTEIIATMDAAREVYQDKRIVMVFEPHRYSRTRDLFDDFAFALTKPDLVVLLDVYPAGEAPIANINSANLARAVRNYNKDDVIAIGNKDLTETLNLILKDGDVVFSQGAGSVSKKVSQVLSTWKKLN